MLLCRRRRLYQPSRNQNRRARLFVRLEVLAHEYFRFERAEEGFIHRVVVAVASGAHRRLHAGLATAPGRILAALIGMQNDSASATLRERHIERTQHQFRVQMIGHCPACDAAAEHIEHDGQIQESLAGRNVGGVGHPQHVRRCGAEVATHQIRGTPCSRA